MSEHLLGPQRRANLSMIGHQLTSRISGGDSLGHTTSFYLRGPCLQQITDSKRQAAASLQQQRQPLSYMPAVFTAGGGRGSFSGIINSLLVSRARSADWTLLEWPFWVMIQCFEMCCYFSYYYMMRHWTAKAGELGSHFSSVSRLRV